MESKMKCKAAKSYQTESVEEKWLETQSGSR